MADYCKHLASILRKAQGVIDPETKQKIDVGGECLALRRECDALTARVRELEADRDEVCQVLTDGPYIDHQSMIRRAADASNAFDDQPEVVARLAAQGEEVRAACLKLGKVRQAIDLAETYGDGNVSTKLLRAALGE